MKSNPVVSCRPAAKRKKKIPSSLLKKAPLISSIILTFGSPFADAQLLHIGDLPDSVESFQITEDTSYGAIVVGGNGTGILEIIEGVSVQTSSLAMGVGANALGTGIFSGTLSVTNTLQIGLSGTGTIIVEEGGHVFATFFQAGIYNNSSGTTIVRGELSINGNFINFGESGDSTLIIENGGSVSATPCWPSPSAPTWVPLPPPTSRAHSPSRACSSLAGRERASWTLETAAFFPPPRWFSARLSMPVRARST